VADFAEGGSLHYLHESLPLTVEEVENVMRDIEGEIGGDEDIEDSLYDEEKLGKDG
jgi:hypothetical protein